MILFQRLRVAELVELCRALRYGLGAGIMLREVMDLLAARGTRRVRLLAGGVSKELKSGWSLQDALAKHQRVLPPLFISLATVGEESGNLPEVFSEMEKYYVLQQKLKREFREQIAGPVMQFTAAILIVALLIYIMGLLPQIPGRGGQEQPLDPLGLGLSGPGGAGIFLGSVCGILASVALFFYLIRRLLRRRAVVERVLLLLPGIGPCLQALAITRFCIAGRLMFETSLSVIKTLRLAFLATDNPAFVAVSPRVEASLRQGNSINTSFERANIFPEKFLSAIGMGEESGRLPEAFRHQAEEYDEEARRRLGWLTRFGSWLVWLGVAVVIITCIFRIFTHAYLSNIQNVLPQ
jgi:type IV pilus assembly protein PilC